MVAAPYCRARGITRSKRVDPLQIDGIENRLPLTPGQRLLHDLGVGGIDHQGEFHHPGDLLQEALDVLGLIAIGVLHADIQHLRPTPRLTATDFGSGLELPFRDESLELPAPRTLVRSPTRRGRLSLVSSTASIPETMLRWW